MPQPSGIPADTAAIVSTTLEGVLYGFSVLMFIGTTWALTRKRRRSEVNWAMVVVACLLLVLSTAVFPQHMIIDIIWLYEGMVQFRDTFPGGPVMFFSDVAQWGFVYKNLMYNLQTLLGDGVVIYRCYIVWQSILIVVVPMIMWCSVAITGFGCVYTLSKATTTAGNIFAKETGTWITAFFATTLATNLLSTTLLAYRIWSVSRSTAYLRDKQSSLVPVLRIILDAGLLYSVTLLTALLCFVSQNRGHYVVLDMIMPIISIAFYMVIIRITISKPKSLGGLQTTTGFMTVYQSQRHHPIHPEQFRVARLEEANKDGSGLDDLSTADGHSSTSIVRV
ncbi:hypothetical protein BV22DRAFT_341940 [Leucogyrophana mollusca]|uniref:Uncharacterized protein n=1 Tax=Leucogyrophana mollusca TaxID=85980 RepID=A0ACB8BNX7_9AGAM|nr:hypothetical protein BV22DRAFT_341940 [Leucogyrophana mollusca]